MDRRLFLFGLLLGAVLALAIQPGSAVAQFTSQVLEVTGIGGRSIDVSGTVSAAVYTDPGVTIGVSGPDGARLQAEVTGPGGAAVQTALSQSTLNALNNRLCTVAGQRKIGVSGTAQAIPPLPGDGGTGTLLGRNAIIINFPDLVGTTGFVDCYASGLDGGVTPECTLPAAGATSAGVPLLPGGGIAYELPDAFVVRCRHCSAGGTPSGSTVVLSYLETLCAPP